MAMARADAEVAEASLPSLLLLLLLFPLLLFLLRRYHGHSCFAATGSSSSAIQGGGRRLPPSPPRLPVIGHMHLLRSGEPHVSLASLAEKHGADDGFMLLHLGQVRNLIVSSLSAAEAVLRAHDHVFASRPHSAVADVLVGGSSDVGLAPYGEYWRQARRLVTTQLLSASKVRSLRRAREEEVAVVVAKLRTEAAGARDSGIVGMSELLNSYTIDLVCRAVSGKFFREEGRNKLFRELVAGNAAQVAGFNLQDYFPSLGKVNVLTRVVCAKTHKLKKKWDKLLDEIIDEHAYRHDDHHQRDKEEEVDFIDVLLSLQQEYDLTRVNVRAILMDMFAAGTDTSYIVLEFAMVELIRKPHLMRKLQTEVRVNTPNNAQKTVKEDNLNNTHFLGAVVKETLRLHPPAPLLLPHLSMADCDVNGYTIPAGTRVIINAWALGRDCRSWERPDEFMPERFMDSGDETTTIDFKGRHFQLLPFGAGEGSVLG